MTQTLIVHCRFGLRIEGRMTNFFEKKGKKTSCWKYEGGGHRKRGHPVNLWTKKSSKDEPACVLSRRLKNFCWTWPSRFCLQAQVSHPYPWVKLFPQNRVNGIPNFLKFCSSWIQYVGKYFSRGIFTLVVKFNWVNYIFRITSLALIDVENVSFTLQNVFAELKMSNQEKCLQVAKSDFDYFRILKRDFTNLQVVIKKVWIAKISHYTIWWITFIDE